MNVLFYVAMLTYFMINSALFTAPNVIARDYLSHGLSALPFGLLLASVNMWLLLSVYNRFPKLTVVEINRYLCGKWVGNALSVLYVAMTAIIGFFMFRGSMEVILEFLLPNTPVWFLALLLVSVPSFVLFHNDSSVLYLTVFFTAIAFLLMLAIFWLGFKETDPFMLRGVVAHGWKMPNLQGITAVAFIFGGCTTLSVWNPFFARTSIRLSFVVFGTVGLLVTLCGTIIPLSVWGPWAIRNLNLIWVMTAETFSLDLFVMERGLFTIIPLLLITGYMGIFLYTYKGYRLMDLLFGGKKAARIVILAILCFYVVLSVFVKEPRIIYNYRERYMTVWVLYQTGLGIFLYALARRKGRGSRAS